MLKITELSNLVSKIFKADDNKVVDNGNNKANKMVVNLSKNNESEKLTYMPNIGATRKNIFLIPNAKKAFNYLQLAFIKAPIL